MIKVQELRNYFPAKENSWEPDITFSLKKPALQEYMGVWYLTGESTAKVYTAPTISRYEERTCWIPIMKNRFPSAVLRFDCKGHKNGDVYYFRHIISIDGVIYPEWWILDHMGEVQIELDRIRTEDLLREIK